MRIHLCDAYGGHHAALLLPRAMYVTQCGWGVVKIWYNFVIIVMHRYLPSIEETRSRLLCSRFISCLVATLSRVTAEGLLEDFPLDMPRSFHNCVTELAAHGKLRYLSSLTAISDWQQRTRAVRWRNMDSPLPCLWRSRQCSVAA